MRIFRHVLKENEKKTLKNFGDNIPGGGGWAASSPTKFILAQKRGLRESFKMKTLHTAQK